MPTSLVAGWLDVLLPVISRIVNLSLSCGHFSEEWKQALVTPILKKPGLDPTQLHNLRPVSNLDFISKLTERAVFDEIHNWPFIQPHNPLTERVAAQKQRY